MTNSLDTRRNFLTGWSSTAFIVAGVLFAVFAAFWFGQTFVGVVAPEARGPFGAAGWFAAFTGLLGLAPSLVERARGLTRTGAVAVGIGLIGAGVSAIGGFGLLFGFWGEEPAWFGVTNLLIMVGIIPGFLAFGAAILQIGVMARSMGVLVLLPALIFLFNMIVNVGISASLGLSPPAWGAMILASGQTIVLLAIGLELRKSRAARDPIPPGQPEAHGQR